MGARRSPATLNASGLAPPRGGYFPIECNTPKLLIQIFLNNEDACSEDCLFSEGYRLTFYKFRYHEIASLNDDFSIHNFHSGVENSFCEFSWIDCISAWNWRIVIEEGVIVSAYNGNVIWYFVTAILQVRHCCNAFKGTPD